MAQADVDTQRFDPYKNFKFRVRWDGRTVAGVSKVGGLKRTTEVVEGREGDASRPFTSPGRAKFDPITLERGVTHDVEFERWANRGRTGDRKDLTLELTNEAGQLVIAYTIFRSWVSEFQALPDLDASANGVAIRTLRLEHEGWGRDHRVTEPTEPSFPEP